MHLYCWFLWFRPPPVAEFPGFFSPLCSAPAGPAVSWPIRPFGGLSVFPRRLAAFFLWPGASFRLEGAPLVGRAFVRRVVTSRSRDVVLARRRVRATSRIGDPVAFCSSRPPGSLDPDWRSARCPARPPFWSCWAGCFGVFGARPLLGFVWLCMYS